MSQKMYFFFSNCSPSFSLSLSYSLLSFTLCFTQNSLHWASSRHFRSSCSACVCLFEGCVAAAAAVFSALVVCPVLLNASIVRLLHNPSPTGRRYPHPFLVIFLLLCSGG
jgi:hypothetical protein